MKIQFDEESLIYRGIKSTLGSKELTKIKRYLIGNEFELKYLSSFSSHYTKEYLEDRQRAIRNGDVLEISFYDNFCYIAEVIAEKQGTKYNLSFIWTPEKASRDLLNQKFNLSDIKINEV